LKKISCHKFLHKKKGIVEISGGRYAKKDFEKRREQIACRSVLQPLRMTTDCTRLSAPLHCPWLASDAHVERMTCWASYAKSKRHWRNTCNAVVFRRRCRECELQLALPGPQPDEIFEGRKMMNLLLKLISVFTMFLNFMGGKA